MEYDDTTLMMYADGELDHHASLQLEKELTNNPSLQKRLLVFTKTRAALLETEQSSSIPNHITRLIDRLDQPKKEKRTNWRNIFQMFWGHPSLALAASVVFGVVIGAKGMQSVMTTSDIPGIDLPTKSYQSVTSKNTQTDLMSRDKNPSDVIQTGIFKLMDSLDSNPDLKAIKFNLDGADHTVRIVSNFSNSEGKQCKLAQLQSNYLIACLGKNNRWSVRK